MHRLLALALILGLATLPPMRAAAQSDPRFDAVEPSNGPLGILGQRQRLGYGRYATNDIFGDGEDRWRTGSLTSSRVWGYSCNGQVPYTFGELIEMRLSGQVMQPANLRQFDPADRRWAGALSVGVHTHFMTGATEISVGGEMVVIGPQTYLDEFQTFLHRTFNIQSPSDTVYANQIGNRIRPTFSGEVARTFAFNDSARIRPFLDARLGDETFVRAGADLTFGVMGLEEFLVRDSFGGHRMRVIKNDKRGLSLVMGADLAHVFDSVYLPDETGPVLRDTRERARLGVQWQNQGTGFFYGLTYLGEEFHGQSEGQVIGTVKLDIRW